MKEIKRIGTIVNTYGLKGTLKVNITTSYPEVRYKKGNTVIVKDKKYVIKKVTIKSEKTYLVDLQGFDDINQVIDLLNSDIFMEVEAPEGCFYYQDLKSCKVLDLDNNILDTVKYVQEGDYQDLIYLENNSNVIPLQIGIFINRIDIEYKKIYLTELGKQCLTDI